jgi:hypothetical protein
MTDTAAEPTYLLLREAAALVPSSRGSGRCHPATLTRWILQGVRAVGGRRVNLRAVRRGSTWLTTRPWLEQFLADCAGPDTAPPPVRTPGQRARADRIAAKKLEKLRIC